MLSLNSSIRNRGVPIKGDKRFNKNFKYKFIP